MNIMNAIHDALLCGARGYWHYWNHWYGCASFGAEGLSQWAGYSALLQVRAPVVANVATGGVWLHVWMYFITSEPLFTVVGMCALSVAC